MRDGSVRPVIVGIGELLWDCFPNRAPRLGGATANVAFHAAQLGAEGLVVSRVGNDPDGERAIQTLQAQKMTTAFIQQDDAHPTGTVDVTLSSAGQPAYTICENVAWDFVAWNADLETLAKRASAVVFGSLAQRSKVSQATIHRFVNAAPPGAVRLFDVNLRQHFYTVETLRESLGLATVLKINDEELALLSPLLDSPPVRAAAVERLIADFDLSLVALTLGAAGAELYPAGKSVVRVAAAPVDVVDTVGAGDAFTAALLMGLMTELPLAKVGRLANRIGGYVAGQSGATPIFPPALLEEWEDAAK